uniref:Uncharacterized protein n=1 Tax=Physcomitrium patens TaxID=3218 RepID=A0A2K1J110_PHYPA|nr:hypothetical protein PHYPA_023105 [Physcomitrium patens]
MYFCNCGGCWPIFFFFEVDKQAAFAIMGKQISEIKDFLLTALRKDAQSVKIKHSRDVININVRCKKCLYSLCL